MNSFYSFQFPAVPETFFGDLLTLETIQDHWLETSAQVQRDWLANTRDLFSYYASLAQESQNIQNLFFGQYIDWFKSWSGLYGVPAVVARSKQVVPISSQTELQSVAEGTEADSPKLLGWVVDDLTRIQGIGKVLQQRLYEEGVVSYYQIATWDADEIARIEDEVLGSRFSGRVARDQWQAQARDLMKTYDV
ncbi:MAG: hypothetical protein KDI83_09975 [Gammaproteobacteria bacterium]|nr:hypothetical protein [Gammaproteobacteria bacterium]